MIRISDNMVLKPDQQRVKSLIQETLTLLCKNGLHYDLEFTIDAVIGVTLDKSNLFYMSIAETVTGGGAKTLLDTESLEDVHGTAISDEPQPNHVPKQTPSKPKKRKPLKKEEEESPVVGTQASSEINYGAEDHDVDLENLLEVGESPKAKKPRIITPSVHLPVKSDNETGTVYVKQEMVDDDSWAGEGGNDTFCESEGEASMTSFDHSTPGPSHRNASHSGVYTGSDGDQSRDGQWASMLTDEGSLTQSMVAASDQSITESDQKWNAKKVSSKKRSKKRLQCSDCGKMFESTSGLRRHINGKHLGKYAYHCSLCRKGCEDKRGLESHMSTHTGVKNYSCHVCGKNFATLSRLQQHFKLHKCFP